MKLQCDTCGQESHDVNTKNPIEAQRILIGYYNWKVYRTTPDVLTIVWKRACPECTKTFAIRKYKERKRAKDAPT